MKSNLNLLMLLITMYMIFYKYKHVFIESSAYVHLFNGKSIINVHFKSIFNKSKVIDML